MNKLECSKCLCAYPSSQKLLDLLARNDLIEAKIKFPG